MIAKFIGLSEHCSVVVLFSALYAVNILSVYSSTLNDIILMEIAMHAQPSPYQAVSLLPCSQSTRLMLSSKESHQAGCFLLWRRFFSFCSSKGR